MHNANGKRKLLVLMDSISNTVGCTSNDAL